MKVGDQVKCSDRSVKHAKRGIDTGELLADFSERSDIDSFYVVKSCNGFVNVWRYIAPVEEYEPFTYETFPDGLVMFKHKTEKRKGAVLEVDQDCVTINSFYISFSDFMDEYLMSLDFGKTWQVAGVIKAGESE